MPTKKRGRAANMVYDPLDTMGTSLEAPIGITVAEWNKARGYDPATRTYKDAS